MIQLVLPMQHEGRQIPPPASKELGLHITVAELLEWSVAPGWAFTHPASGEKRDKRTASKLKAMGLKPGWPDLILISPGGRFHGLELKAPGASKSLRGAQKQFKAHCDAHGWPHAVARTFDEAKGALCSWGALKVRNRGPS